MEWKSDTRRMSERAENRRHYEENDAVKMRQKHSMWSGRRRNERSEMPTAEWRRKTTEIEKQWGE